MKAKGKEIKKAVLKLWKKIEVKAKIEEIREIGKRNRKNRKIVLVMKLEDRKAKLEV